MDAGSARRDTTVAVSMGLLAASLVTLYVGGFIQFDDITGYGSDRWVVPLGWLAGCLALGAVATAFQDRRARRWVGGALAVLVAALASQTLTNDGFRFVWGAQEGELFHLQVVLGLTAMALAVPTFGSPTEPTEPTEPTDRGGRTPRRRNGWERATAYLIAIALGMFLAFVVGTRHFEESQCSGPDFDGDCDLAVLGGLFWAACTFALGLACVVVAELWGFRKRRVANRTAG